MEVKITEIPKRIYLNLGDLSRESGEIPFSELSEVTWCEDRIDDDDSEYVHVSEVERLRAERDEADRRAGAAEREKESLAEACHARQSWLDKAKDQWGVDRNVSFDVVWAEALALKVAQSKGE